MLEREKYGLDGLEDDRKETRYILILGDNWGADERWVRVFNGAADTRCCVPAVCRGFSDDLFKKLDPRKVVLMVADWFYDSAGYIQDECREVLRWLREANPEAFIVEASFASRGKRRYSESNVSINGLRFILSDEFGELAGAPSGSREERIYRLWQLMVPELAIAKQLDKGDISQAEVFSLYYRLRETDRLGELLDDLGVENHELGGYLKTADVNLAAQFLHCAYDYIAQKKLGHDDRYYGMALSRMRMILEVLRTPGPSA